MNMTSNPERAASESCPQLGITHWGYVLTRSADGAAARRVGAIGGRFFGAILLFAAAGLWVMPDAMLGAEVFAMKLAAMVMFTVFGGWLFWAGQQATDLEYQVDTSRGELRVVSRDLRGNSHLKGTLDFSDIASVYLLRSKDHSLPTRLFLRVGAGDQALEVASGSQAALEALRDRLIRDLAPGAQRPQRPIAARLARHAALAA